MKSVTPDMNDEVTEPLIRLDTAKVGLNVPPETETIPTGERITAALLWQMLPMTIRVVMLNSFGRCFIDFICEQILFVGCQGAILLTFVLRDSDRKALICKDFLPGWVRISGSRGGGFRGVGREADIRAEIRRLGD